MFFYWFLLVFCTGVFYIGKMFVRLPEGELYTRENNREMKFCFILVSVLMIFIISMRHVSIGNDTFIYKHYFFDKYAENGIKYMFENEESEWGYALLQIFFNRIGFGFEAFNVVYATFNVCVIMRLIYKWSDIPWLSCLLFFFFGFFVLNLTMMRQITAMSIVILAVMNDDDNGFKGFLKFAVMLGIAFSIHTSAVVAIPMWIIKKVKFSGKTVAVFFLLIFLAYIFKTPLTKLVANFASGMTERYDHYDVEKNGELGTLFYIMMLVTMVASVFMSSFLSDRKNQTLFMFMAVMLIIFPTTQVGGAAMRIYYYYYIFAIIFIPNMLTGMRRRRDLIMYFITLVLFIAVGFSEYHASISDNQYNMVPYHFFWEEV